MHQPTCHYVLTLEFRGSELGRWDVGTTPLRIGRSADNHIVIDNLSVSRVHAVVEMCEGGLVILDRESANGTFVNGRRVDRSVLSHGDVVTVGGHEIVCRVAAPDGHIPDDPALFESTILGGDERLPGPVPSPATLSETSRERERTYVLDRGLMIIGSDEASDIVILGRGIAPYHAEIRFLNGKYSIRHLDGRTRVKVNGKTVKEGVLDDGFSIVIGDFSFAFSCRASVSVDS